MIRNIKICNLGASDGNYRQIIFFGISSMDPAVLAQVKKLRDSCKIVHLYGTLLSNVPDYNGSQIQMERNEVE